MISVINCLPCLFAAIGTFLFALVVFVIWLIRSQKSGENDRRYSVEGVVSSRQRAASVGRLKISVMDKTNSAQWDNLAQTETDENGRYEVAFRLEADRLRGVKRPALQVTVATDNKNIALSEVRYNAFNNSFREVINVEIPEAASTALPSEYESLLSDLARYYAGRLGQLRETRSQPQITYFANKSGWDARLIAMAALGDQFSEDSRDGNDPHPIDAAFFYGLFRAKVSTNKAILYHTDILTVESVWQEAIEMGIIPKSLALAIPQAKEDFLALAQREILTEPPLVGVSSMGDMLTLSLGDDQAKKLEFVKIYKGLNTEYEGDWTKLWRTVEDRFGEATTKRMQVDGKLAYLTINNVPLIEKIHSRAGGNGLDDSLKLVSADLYRSDQWNALVKDLSEDQIPAEIGGNDIAERRVRYSEALGAQVRLSYPTMVMGRMVETGDTLVAPELKNKVNTFLVGHQAAFQIGLQPVGQYVQTLPPEEAPDTEVVKEIEKIQRVYQITPSDEAMNALLDAKIESAYQVVQYDKARFVEAFKYRLGGETAARLTYAKAEEVHNAVLNIALAYQTTALSPAIGSNAAAPILTGQANREGLADSVLTMPTMESIFGELDYCACEHCRSILSPAAYLVDLLKFCEPSENPPEGKQKPLDELLARRPDIEHLPLTCENTNTPLPHIDLVNEVLEYFVFKEQGLDGYLGHSTDGSATPEELLASPQFGDTEASVAAYEKLAHEYFPPPLPFHQPLENLRRYFDRFEAPLSKVMEVLRKDDNLERASTSSSEYGWRDILMEELRLSRPEHRILTNYNPPENDNLTLQELYGFDQAVLESNAITELSKAKDFSRRVGISYEEVTEILRTRFVNPHSALIPKLERLGVPFLVLKGLKAGTITDEEFDKLLPPPPQLDLSQYGGDVKAWVKSDPNYANIMSVILLTDPDGSIDSCNFDKLEFRYSDPDKINSPIRAFEFCRLIRFIRLWKKLDWSIEQTDKAITALYPLNQIPNSPDDAVNLRRLDQGFLTLLPRLAMVKRIMSRLNLDVNRDLLPLLTCFAPIDTHGITSLYRQMFLSPALLKQHPAFADNGYGQFIADDTQTLLGHSKVLRAAFQLTEQALSSIIAALGFDSNTKLGHTPTDERLEEILGRAPNNEEREFLTRYFRTDNISAVFRRAWLARKLKVSVQELLLLMRCTGIDPFAAPDPPDPNNDRGMAPIIRLLDLVDRFRTASLKPTQPLYLIWNLDISGKSVPGRSEILGFARTLRAGLATIENEFAIVEDPDASITRARMAQVYGSEVTDFFFGLLDNTLLTEVQYNRGQPGFVTQVDYEHAASTLEQAIRDVPPSLIRYDHADKKLSISGAFTASYEDALKKVPGVTEAFKNAVDLLFVENQKVIQANLAQAIVNVAPGRIAYDDFRKRLRFSGVLTEDTRDTLKSVGDPDFDAAVDRLDDESQKVVGPFFDRFPILKQRYDEYVQSSEEVEKKRKDLLATLLQDLIPQRKRQQALQAMSAAATAEVGFASAVLDNQVDNKYVLHAAGDNAHPGLDDLTALEKPGLSVRYFFGDTATGVAKITSDAEANLAYSAAGINRLPPNGDDPANAISGIWSGYLAAPENGFHNFLIEADAAATVTLTLDDTTVPLAQDDNVWSNSLPVELRAGTLYAITLKAEKIKNTLLFRWGTTSRGREIIPSQYLYSATLTERLRDTYIRFLKVAALASSLKLTTNETVHFASNTGYQIGNQGWLNSLAVAGSPDTGSLDALLKAFLALLDFARMKAELSSSDERFLGVLKNPLAEMPSLATLNSSPQLLLISLTGWEPSSLDALLRRFGMVLAGNADRTALKDLEAFERIYAAYAYLKKLGISADDLIGATTNEPNANIVRDLQSALRARYSDTDWLSVLKPINDEMRRMQRDALVTQILHKFRNDPNRDHIDTPDKLFEYFLMDVQMEPCMQTSRIRHALSSVQLFIERCLMNLERTVASSSIDAEQWAWMKRYRVWEANRKVFLYPENWLEPELRDDQSAFFKESMSELLQGDITEDRAATALINYLGKLDEVAKLEPCGLHYVDNDPAKREDDVAHVVARTAGANRKYYYRRREPSGWTPWEQIKLDIEDNPVIPVVWRNRLFLFWLRIIKQSPIKFPTQPPTGLSLADLPASTIIRPDGAKMLVQAILCWSEYYDGKWQQIKTSEVSNPTTIGEFDISGASAFDRNRLSLSTEEQADSLRIFLKIGQMSTYFRLINTHSLPIRKEDDRSPTLVPNTYFSIGLERAFDVSAEELTIAYSMSYTLFGRTEYKQMRHHILTTKRSATLKVTSPMHVSLLNYVSPLFVEDSYHVFYATLPKGLTWVPYANWEPYIISPLTPVQEITPPVTQPDSGSDVTRTFDDDDEVEYDGTRIGPDAHKGWEANIPRDRG